MTTKVNLTLVTFWPKPEALEQAKAAADEAARGKVPTDAEEQQKRPNPSTGNKP